MSTLVHSHMCTGVPEILGNMCPSVPKGPPLSFLVLLLRFSNLKGYSDLSISLASVKQKPPSRHFYLPTLCLARARLMVTTPTGRSREM